MKILSAATKTQRSQNKWINNKKKKEKKREKKGKEGLESQDDPWTVQSWKHPAGWPDQGAQLPGAARSGQQVHFVWPAFQTTEYECL